MRPLAAALVLLFGCWLCRADTRLLEAGTPLYRSDPETALPELVLTVPTACPATECPPLWQREGFAMHRLERLAVTLPDGSAWIALPQLVVRPGETPPLRLRPPAPALGDRLLLIGCLALVTGCFFVLRRRRNDALDLAAERVLPLALRSGLLAAILMGAGAIYLFSGDEPDFFVTCSSLMRGDFSIFQPRSLGTGLWYFPFARLTGAAEITGILAPFSYFSAFVVAPLALFCWQGAASRLADRKSAFASALLMAILPLFWFHFEPGDGAARGLFQLPTARLSYEFYQTMIAGGFCAMSDTPAEAMLFAALALALLRRPAAAFGSGLCFGMAMLLRVNALLYLPALLIAPLCRPGASARSSPPNEAGATFRSRRSADRRTWLRLAGWMLLPAALAMAPQLLMNALQLGNPFVFPYIRYENTADGFAFAHFLKNWPLLMRGNRVFLFAGLSGLALMRDRRAAGLLALWIAPTLLFFLGYFHTEDDLVRFILPLYAPLLLAAWVGWRDLLAERSPKRRRIAWAALAAVALTGAPLGDPAYGCWDLPPVLAALPGVLAAVVLIVLTFAALRRREVDAAVWLPPAAALLYLAGIPF